MSAPGPSPLGWYLRRASRMSPSEMAWRARDQAVQLAWARRQVTREQVCGGLPPLAPAAERRFIAVLPPGIAEQVPDEAKAAVVEAAGRLMDGEWKVLGLARSDLAWPDWFRDPVTGLRSDPDRCAFRINHRSQEQTGNIKQIWEVARLQHLTVLATAWLLTHDPAYPERVAVQLRSWWQENPFLSGVHWTSGIEIGLRLISMVWIRRLLDGWPGVGGLFEDDALAVRQIYWHQRYLATFPSRGSSANNHVIAEAAGQLVASCAFPWFGDSERWRRQSAHLLERELVRNTFPSGIGRELASGYHCFIAELGLVAAAEAEARGRPLSSSVQRRLCAMVDSAAALLDGRLRPPRQGDDDEGRGLLLDGVSRDRWVSLLALGAAFFGRLGWWPRTAADARSVIAGAVAQGPAPSQGTCGGACRVIPDIPGRPARRPSRFPDAGITLLRTDADDTPEIWCRCDGGPHGYLRTAAHAHADALSVEVRYGGADILADPGTYAYHGEPRWRSYFRSTIAHNTLEIGGQSQSRDGGPFLWLRHANAREIDVRDDGEVAEWTGEHNGYASLRPPVRHRRIVRLNRPARSLEIVDEIDADPHDVRLAFHLGPHVQAELDGVCAVLVWPGAPAPGARLELPGRLRWSLHRGEVEPILGWYSPGLGRRVPISTLLGQGRCAPGEPLATRLEFPGSAATANPPFTRSPVSRGIPATLVAEARLRSEGEWARNWT